MSKLSCASSLQSLQSPQLRIGRQLGWHPMGTCSDFFFENNWNAASLTSGWPEVSMMGADHLRKIAGYDFYDLRRKYDVRTM